MALQSFRIHGILLLGLFTILAVGCTHREPLGREYSDPKAGPADSSPNTAPIDPAESGQAELGTSVLQLEPDDTLGQLISKKGISQAEKDAYVMGRIGSDLGLRLFLDRIEANVGRLTYDDIVARWGKPDSIIDRGWLVLAVWKWALPGETADPDEDQEAAPKTIKHGEQVSLTFNKNSRKLTGWQYGSW